MITTHGLEFEVAHNPHINIGDPNTHKIFRVGTCDGTWGDTGDSYYILAIINSQEGNGHLEDVFEWFEGSCRRDNKNLLVLEIMNDKFYDHLLKKRGFIPLDKDKTNCIKIFNKKAYKKLLKRGNSIISKNDLKCI